MFCFLMQIINFVGFPIYIIVKWKEVSKFRHLKYFLLGLAINMTVTMLLVNFVFMPTFFPDGGRMKKIISGSVFQSDCSCRKSYYSILNAEAKLQSSCSDEGTTSQGNQNVISFSLNFDGDFSSDRRDFYAERIKQNLERMRKLYAGFTMRIYTNVPAKNEFCNLLCHNPDLYWCDVRQTPNLGDKSMLNPKLWGSLPLGDPTVSLFLERNLESVITPREAAAVNDWLQLNRSIHLMRDLRDIRDIEILDGFWGASNVILGEEAASNLRDSIARVYDRNQEAENGQGVNLESEIFLPMELNVVVHDSYHCLKWSKFALVRPFPRKRDNEETDFVGFGNMDLGGAKRQAKKISICPKQCRPSYGMDWKYC